jgi:threonine dehydrogenase-like Zn-dependent dehydrogenase
LTAISAVAPLGQVVALGVYRHDLAAVIPVSTLLEKESPLRGSKAYRVNDERDDFATALDLLANSHGSYARLSSPARLHGHRTTRSRLNSSDGTARSKRSP